MRASSYTLLENVRQGNPQQFTLRVLDPDRLERLLSRAREKHYFEVPWPVSDYDQTPVMLSEGEQN